MKIQTLLKSIFGVTVIAVLLSMVSCDSSKNPSALVGRWVEEEGKEIMELLSDGTGIVTYTSYYGMEQGAAITWKTENGRFYVTGSGAKAFGYKIQDSTLTFTEDNGKISKYTKCRENCQEIAREAKAGGEILFENIESEDLSESMRIDETKARKKAR